MITISVGGKPLYIPEDTALVLEQSNNVFDNDGYTDDVVWTFELPAQPNQSVLGAVQYIYTGGRKRYECELSVDGVPFSLGTLYIQNSTDETRLNCGIVTNSFGVGFGSQMLRDNNYGADVEISSSEANHQSGWLAFLKASTEAESIFKFFLFADESFYRENEDFGYHQDSVSGLMGVNNEEQFCKYVNRLFLDASGNVINNADTVSNNKVLQGVRIFNTTDIGKHNGYCFAPAIRLDWLVRQVLRNAGLSAMGTFLSNPKIHQLFSQSLNAMDGDVFQYGVKTWIHVGGNINTFSNDIQHCIKFDVDANADQHPSFGWISGVNFGFRLLLPVEELVFNDTTSGDYKLDQYEGERLDEIYALAIGSQNGTLPTIRAKCSTVFNEADGTPSFVYGRLPKYEEIKERVETADDRDVDSVNSFENFSNGSCRANYGYSVLGLGFNGHTTVNFVTPTGCILLQLTKSASKQVFYSGTLGGYTEGNVAPRINGGWSSSTPLFIRLVKVKVLTAKNDIAIRLLDGAFRNTAHLSSYGDLEYLDGYEILDNLDIDTTDTPLNIFSNVLRWRDHVPNLTNGEFLSLICKIFGLNMYANPMTREIQLSFFSDVMQAQCFDISQWVSTVERQEYKPKEYKVQITPALSTKSVSSGNILPPSTTVEDLPPAVVHKNKHAYVEAEKAYRRSTIIKDSSRFQWEQAGGDDRTLIAGAKMSEESEEVSIEANVPNMRMVDEEIGKTKRKYICELNVDGNSPLLDEDYTGEFDFVLQQYHGQRLLALPDGITVTQAYIEDANPTRYTSGDTGTTNSAFIDIAADGKGSIGQMWLRPLYQFLGNCENFRFTAHLPVWAFQKVYGLLKPQSGSPSQQTRWIYVRGNRYLPTKMSFEFGAGQYVIATIECAAPHFDL